MRTPSCGSAQPALPSSSLVEASSKVRGEEEEREGAGGTGEEALISLTIDIYALD